MRRVLCGECVVNVFLQADLTSADPVIHGGLLPPQMKAPLFREKGKEPVPLEPQLLEIKIPEKEIKDMLQMPEEVCAGTNIKRT